VKKLEAYDIEDTILVYKKFMTDAAGQLRFTVGNISGNDCECGRYLAGFVQICGIWGLHYRVFSDSSRMKVES